MNKGIILVVASLILSLFATNQALYAQLTYDPGDSEIVLANSSGSEGNLWLTMSGLVFNCDLELSVGYYGNGTGGVADGEEIGFDVCWDSSGVANGDVDDYCGIIACGEYRFTAGNIGVGTTFSIIINLIDANWGAATSTDDIYKLYLEYTGSGSFDIYVRDPDTGNWMAADNPYSDGDKTSYWELVRATWDEDYERERTETNSKSFTTSLPGLPPYPSTTTVYDAELDVNVTVEEDATICSTCEMKINPFDEGTAASSQTILEFDGGAGLHVNGELYVGTKNYYGEYVTFKPSSASPSAGDWDGITGSSADTIDLYKAYVTYATCGINLDDCQDVRIRKSLVDNSDEEGINLIDSKAWIDTVDCSSNGGTNLRVYDGSIAYVDTSVFSQSTTSNGITVDDVSYMKITNSSINTNRYHGIVGSSYGRVVVDSCDVYNNGYVSGVDSSDAYGIYSFYNNWLISVRNSDVHGNRAGLAAHHGHIVGYYKESFSQSATFSNPDSLARNCIYENDFNIYGNYGRYEMAKTLLDTDSKPHYQGSQSSIFDPSQYQVMAANTTAYLDRNYWNNDHVFVVVSSTVSNIAELDADSAGCPVDSLQESSSSNENSIPSALQLYRSWEVQTADTIKGYISSNISTIASVDVNEALFHLSRKMTPSDFEKWLKALIQSASRNEVKIPAYRYLAELQVEDESWTDAVDSYIKIARMSNRAQNSDYTKAYAIAAMTMAYGGNPNDGKAAIDSLLKVFPNDMDLSMAWSLIHGSVTAVSPKEKVDANPSTFGLSDPYPNPFKHTTNIAFTVPHDGKINIGIYDYLGRRVRLLVDDNMRSGSHIIAFDASGLRSGIYFCRMTGGDEVFMKRLTILK